MDRYDNTMAQLVDGKSVAIFEQFEYLLHCSATSRIQSHPDWHSLKPNDQQFVLNFLAIMIIQTACSFERRNVQLCEGYPIVLLSFAKVRHDIPCMKRQALPKDFLNQAAEGQLDVDSMKVLNAYRSDIETAANSGLCGARFYIAMKGVRRLFRADVRENERLNKQLKLYGERSPSASLDLVSSRLTLEFFLGVVGARQEGLFGTKNKKWSILRPLASTVMDKCLEHWVEGQKIMASTERFAASPVPTWCPTNIDVKEWQPVESWAEPSFQISPCQPLDVYCCEQGSVPFLSQNQTL